MRNLIYIMLLSLVLISLMLTSCGAIQDVGVASSQLVSDEQAAGLKTLKDLANKGYVDAQERLAAYYSDRLDEEGIAEAKYWFSKLEGRSEKSALLYARWLANLSMAYPKYRAEAHRALLQRQEQYKDVTVELVRFYMETNIVSKQELPARLKSVLSNVSLSDRDHLRVIDAIEMGEFSRARVERLCAELTQQTALYCLRIEARHYMRAANASAENITSDIVNAYAQGLIREPQLVSIIGIFMNHKWELIQPAVAYDIVIKTNPGSDALFLSLAKEELKQKHNYPLDELLVRLNLIHDKGIVRASFLLGKLYDLGQRVPEDPWKAVHYYQFAERNPEARFRSGRIYLSGKLGESRLQKGVDLLLSAARDKHINAYRELFHVFSGYPGVQVNPVYAHIFASAFVSYGEELTQYDREILAKLPLRPEARNDYEILLAAELDSKNLASIDVALGDFSRSRGEP